MSKRKEIPIAYRPVENKAAIAAHIGRSLSGAAGVHGGILPAQAKVMGRRESTRASVKRNAVSFGER